jgi:hypothetical protein
VAAVAGACFAAAAAPAAAVGAAASSVGPKVDVTMNYVSKGR